MTSNNFDSNQTSEIFNFGSLVEFHNGSVVSRAIIKKPAGTVTVFAFDEGEGLSPHAAPFDALVNIIHGEAQIMIADKQFSLQEGDSIIMPANIPHAVKAVKEFKMLLIMIKE